MYPLRQEQPFPYRQWWIAAYSNEVGREPLGRTILGMPLVFYRTQAGEAVALHGVCPHRMFPLARGRVVGDHLQCGYHGFTFDRAGACVAVPSQGGEPANASVRRYPAVERGGLVWVWTGEAELADEALLPDVAAMGLGVSGWAVEQHPRAVIRGRYMLLIDNLIDLSHISFIHRDTIPNGEAVAQIPHELAADARSLNVRRLGRGIPNNPHTRMLFPDYDGPTDQSFDAEFFGPCLVRTGGTIYASGEGRPLGVTNFIHGVTPETPTSTHYFVLTARNFALENPALGAMNLSMGERIQPQDVDAIEAIERNLQAGYAVREVSCFADAGALQVRRRIDAQIRAEAGGADLAQAG